MAMECPKCESKAICVDTEDYRLNASEPLTQVRTYACSNVECLHGFQYRSSYLKETERLDVEKFIKRYNRDLRDKQTGQTKMEMDNE